MNAATKILIILADDLGWGNIGIDTPHILQLMQESLVFRNAHAPVSWCAPTRWAIMQGRYPYTKTPAIVAPVTAPLMSATAPTLAKHMRTAGYKTGIFGKWHLGGNPLDYGFQRAFWYRDAHNLPAMMDDRDPINPTIDKVLPRIVGQAVKFMGDYDRWFVYAALPTPHRPILGTYSEWVGACDNAVRDLVAAAGPDAMVIVTSDNGTEERAGIDHDVPNPNRGWKQSLYDGGTRVPFCVRHPNLEPGETDQLVSLHDIPATLGALVGFVAHADSTDIFGVPRSHLITQDKAGRYAVRNSGGWKLHVASGLLYHMPTDPKEATPRDEPEIAEGLAALAP